MSIEDVISLFCEVCKDAQEFAQISVQLENRPSKSCANDLQYETSALLKKACKHSETKALVIPLIVGAMEYVTKTYAVSLEELLSGEANVRIDRYNKLMNELKTSPIAQQWADTYQKIGEVIKRMGLTADENLLKDMPKVSKIMLNAFEFFDQYYTKVLKVTKGKCEGNGIPFVYRSMPKYATVGEFYDSFNGAGIPENAVAFAVIAPTYNQTKDPQDEWKRAVNKQYNENVRVFDERMHNMARNNPDFNPEKDCDTYLSRIAVGIKRGENIWLIIHEDESSRHGDFFNHYGKRTSFMPFQVLFNDAPKPNTDCTDLMVARHGAWDLPSIVDEEQSLWLPVFIWLVQKKYFTKPVDENEAIVYLGETISVANGTENTHLPVVQKQMVIEVDPFTVPDSIKTDPDCEKLIRCLCITNADIKDAVIRPTSIFGDEILYRNEIWLAARKVVRHVAMCKINVDYNTNARTLKNMIIARIENNREFLLEELATPSSPIHRMAWHIIDNQPVVENDEVKIKSGLYRHKVIDMMKTSSTNTQKHEYSHMALICSPPSLEGRRPPALVTLAPQTPEDLAFLLNISVDELPWQYLFTTKFVGSGGGVNPKFDPMLKINNPYNRFPTVNMAFGKREYKVFFPNRVLSTEEIAKLIKSND